MKLYETITAENWKKGGAGFSDDQANVGCILYHARRLGALKSHKDCAAFTRAVDLLFPERRGPSSFATDFNDHPATTIEDVLRVCKLADV